MIRCGERWIGGKAGGGVWSFFRGGLSLNIQDFPLLRWESFSKRMRRMADKGLLLGPHRHHPSGNCILLRKSIPFITGT